MGVKKATFLPKSRKEDQKAEQKTNKADGLYTIISLKLHKIMTENGIEPEKTDINNNDPTKIVWKYKPNKKFFELLSDYVVKSRNAKKNNTL